MRRMYWQEERANRLEMGVADKPRGFERWIIGDQQRCGNSNQANLGTPFSLSNGEPKRKSDGTTKQVKFVQNGAIPMLS